MDEKWFKARQKEVGVTADDIARRMGRTRSNVSHIYSGKQRMSLEWAQAFADVLQTPLDTILKHAGVLEEKPARQLRGGFADGDVAQWQGRPGDTVQARAVVFGGARAGVDVWTVNGRSMILGGYLPGDYILVDTHQSERCRAGDVVIAQKYEGPTGTAMTVLRRFEPPVLVAASVDPGDQRALVVDWDNVAIRGKVIASWRDE